MSNFSEMSLAEMWPVMEEQINEGKTVKFTPGGNSMLPLIRPGVDSVLIKKAPDRLRKYDLPLYRRKKGGFVLHRVVKAKNGVYVMRGDNQNWLETGVAHEQILAIAVGMYKNGEYISFSGVKYWIYSRKRHLRQNLSRIKRVLIRTLKKTLKKFKKSIDN